MFGTMDIKRRCVLVVLIIFELWPGLTNAEENQKRRHGLRHHSNRLNNDARWDMWTTWTPCSSSCGTGITERSRLCRSMSNGLVVDGCHGVAQQIKICTNTGCIKADESTEACKDLDNISYGGRRYRWEAYKHPIKNCELACRAVGYSFYQGLGRNATNGTSCSNDGSRICVSGLCKAVGCDKIVESNATIDKCGVCGGDGMSCKTITKMFKDSPKFGYKTIGTIPAGSRNIKITEVQESRNYLAVKATDGSFKLNTDWRLSRFGDHQGGGTLFSYARNKGAECPGECITADGPTDVDVQVIGLFYTTNKGIKYSFTVPTNSSNIIIEDGERFEGPVFSHDFTFKRKNGHKHNGHHKHKGKNRQKNRVELKESKEYGVRTREDSENITSESGETRLKSDAGNSYYEADRVSAETNKTNDSVVKGSIGIGELKSKNKDEPGIAEDDFGGGVYLNEPMAKESGETSKEDLKTDENTETVSDDMYKSDNTIPSPYSWRINGYTQCSTSCGEGKQSQVIECIATDKVIKVADQYCGDVQKPVSTIQACTYGPCPPSWKPRAWSKCSVSCGNGIQRRDFVCTRENGREVNSLECSSEKPSSEERSCDVGSCNMGWYHTEWTEECSESCGEGVVSRKIYCSSGSGNPADVCPERSKPRTEKRCKGDTCGANWFTGPWSECNATCGLAFQNRAVVCVLKQRRGRTMVVGDSYCTGEEKPANYMSCDQGPCEPQWYMNEWGRCSVTCGTGQKSRDVKCLDSNKRPSGGCDPASKPRERESCSERRCPPSGPGRPESTDSNCKDTFRSCDMVLQARLCQYSYYAKICCGTCRKQRT